MASHALKIASAIAYFTFLVICVYESDNRKNGGFVYVGQGASDTVPTEAVSQLCLGCICEAASGCNVSAGCSGEVCGPFRITWGYWADSGKPTLNNEPNSNNGAYARCVNDHLCAARAVQGYMAKYRKDCNGDGVVNCDDYIRIHRFGGYACNNALDTKYENTYKYCMQTYG